MQARSGVLTPLRGALHPNMRSLECAGHGEMLSAAD